MDIKNSNKFLETHQKKPKKTNFTNSISSYTTCTAVNYTDVRPAFKKDYKTDKKNYRAISILPTLSKVYKRLNVDSNVVFKKILMISTACDNDRKVAMINCWRWSDRCSSNCSF